MLKQTACADNVIRIETGYKQVEQVHITCYLVRKKMSEFVYSNIQDQLLNGQE